METPQRSMEDVDYNSGNRFTYYYPDKHPSLFVAFIGAGSQGAAIMVRSVLDGKLYVRKREFDNVQYDYEGAPTINSSLNALKHPNINALISQTKLTSLEHPAASTYADLWQYCTGGDLGQFIMSYALRGEPIPEPNIIHSDLIRDNIFVHWPTTTTPSLSSSPADQPTPITSIPPTFLLGEFGTSYTLPLTPRTRRDRKIHSPGKGIRGDLSAFSKNVAVALLAGDRGPEGYSIPLQKLCARLEALPFLLQRYDSWRRCDANGEMYAFIVDPLLRDIEEGLREAEGRMGRMDFGKVRPTQEALRQGPLGFHSREVLLGRAYRPPGPWCVAEVDGEGRLVDVDVRERYCEEEAMVTKEVWGAHWERARREGVIREWREACW